MPHDVPVQHSTKMATPRTSRLPISCEPCRSRKIRCSRDGTPCATCVRRGVPADQCRFAKRATHSTSLGAPPVARLEHVPDRQSPEIEQSSPTNRRLSERIQRLEQLLSAQSTLPDLTNGIGGGVMSSIPLKTASPPKSGGSHLSGSLRHSQSGHVRFVPSSLDWHGQLSMPGSGGDVPSGTSAPQTSALGAVHRERAARQLLEMLPPRSHCTELVDFFFASFASLFHILHDPTFHRQYNCFQQGPESTSLSWLALLYAVLSTAVTGLSADSFILRDLSRMPTPSGRMADLSERYRALAMKCLEADNYLWDHNVTTLQALVLIIYGISHTHGQAWTLLGLAQHLALSLGCHVDPTVFGLSRVECEERRRCWAGLRMLYTSQNAAMGNIGWTHTVALSNTQPPSNVNDNDLEQDHWHQASHGTQQRTPTQMTYLLFKFRLYDLCADICDRVFRSAAIDEGMLQYLDDRIQQERRSWCLTYGVDQSLSLPVHHLAHVNILHSYANHLLLLLHHKNACSHQPGLETPSSHWSRRRCLESAQHVLVIQSLLYESSDMTPFRWYSRGLGAFHAFHAAMTLIMLCPTDVGAYLPALDRCLTQFHQMSDLSPLCARAAPMVEQLLSRLKCSASQPPIVSPSNDSIPSVEDLGGTSNTQSSHRPRTPQSLSTGSGHTAGNPGTDEMNFDLMLSEIQPQQWLAPADLPWEQWDSMVAEVTSSIT